MNVIKADPADAYRVTLNGQRWYCDPLPSCVVAPATDAIFPSVSAVKRSASSDWTNVTLKRIAIALHDDPDMLKGREPADSVKLLRYVNDAGLSAAAARGTNVHTIIEDLMAGRPASVNEGMPGFEYLDAAKAMLADLDAELLYAECVVINRTLHGKGFGGTCDAIVRLPDARTVIVDWKSRGESNVCYPAEKQQLGLYSLGQYLIVNGERHPMPVIDGLLIASVTP